ncbi:hypothetical protein CG51_01115 [Haematobacter missouriensis]|uniref:DUF192 domain-containing protein n=1 Tax=Haematobacter missouriensis TaxID=366616 RepID=A0A212AJP9_9RHOB|nr:DUF192 domain-containing protein [Haematobacter missouriensis]KFI32555.1 hypothetical protein CG51_01115 [Haematobacter missouriensis]OWJ70210.1 hypothetical protein CDV53_20875 [Haematobacter missouriensis]OWJ81722.1 hypothetical protein CDV52_17305 [Haematobacter missouriensis]
MRSFLFALALSAAAGSAGAEAVCRPDAVEIRGPRGETRFSVELADTPDSRAYGLMNRTSLPKSNGMLFIYEYPQHVSFWMRNTLIPLDMIFLDARGVITRIHENARPHDETAIDGGSGVLAVLEINGGLARRLGLVQGGVMRHPAFGADGAWPCGS